MWCWEQIFTYTNCRNAIHRHDLECVANSTIYFKLNKEGRESSMMRGKGYEWMERPMTGKNMRNRREGREVDHIQHLER